jgi:hypothetical protein
MTSLNELGLSFNDPAANWGVRDLGLRLTVAGQAHDVQYGAATGAADSLIAEGTAGAGLVVRSTVEAVPGLDAVVLTHRVMNTSARPVRFTAATGQFATSAAVLYGTGNGLGFDLRYCHTDNVRTERYPHCQMEYPYVRMLPTETVRLGAGEDQPFPALFVKNQAAGRGIVFAAAFQALHYTVFELRKRAMVSEGMFERFAAIHDPGQNDGFELAPGAGLTLDGLYIQLTGDLAAEDVFADYIGWLGGRFPFRGPKTPLLREAFHCTYNYGIFADQSEKSLLPTARFIARHLPNIKWFLMDAGYLAGEVFLDRFYPDANQFVTADKWPRGIRGYADELRQLGLRPGIWWSPAVRVPSRLHDEHPDWFLRNADGSLYLIGGKSGFLDYTVPGALDYLDRTLGVVLGEWGMDACKMDFWSQNFEDRHARLRDPAVTAVQARTRFFETVRKHLPPDGVFMTCVAVGMGNPFIGQWADTYRNTVDIALGTWHEQVVNCCWALPTLGFEGRKTFLLNNDSVGIMAGYPDNENRFRFTWMFMNMGLQETGGRMETWPEKWVKAMRKFTDRCDRGYKVRCPDERAFTGVPLPEALYVDYPSDSPTAQTGVRQSVALFNWTDEPRVVSVLRSRLGQTGPVAAEDFWTGTRETLDGEFLSRRLGPRSALLLDIAAERPDRPRGTPPWSLTTSTAGADRLAGA